VLALPSARRRRSAQGEPGERDRGHLVLSDADVIEGDRRRRRRRREIEQPAQGVVVADVRDDDAGQKTVVQRGRQLSSGVSFEAPKSDSTGTGRAAPIS